MFVVTARFLGEAPLQTTAEIREALRVVHLNAAEDNLDQYVVFWTEATNR